MPFDCYLELYGEGIICNRCFCKKMQELEDKKPFETRDNYVQEIITVENKRYRLQRIEQVAGTNGLSICYEQIHI